MTKWLIRTHSNHFLGPVSKAKLQELMAMKSLGARDEVCSGNGYWFNLEENELVDRYINGEEKQPFNPLSEHEVEDTQTGFFNLRDINAPVITDNQTPPLIPLELESSFENLVPHEDDSSEIQLVTTPDVIENSSFIEQNEIAKRTNFFSTKTIFLLVIVVLSGSVFLLKDRILEFKQDLNFFEKTSDFQIFSPAYAQEKIQKDSLRLKKK